MASLSGEAPPERGFYVAFAVFLIGVIVWFDGMNLGSGLFSAGVLLLIFDALVVGPWLYADIERRMAEGVTST